MEPEQQLQEKLGYYLQERIADWVRSRLGLHYMHPRERAMRLLEEAIELAQAEGINVERCHNQVNHVYNRPKGEPEMEAAGVAVCLLAWCNARSKNLFALAAEEIARIESKSLAEIRSSLKRKTDAGLSGGLNAAGEST